MQLWLGHNNAGLGSAALGITLSSGAVPLLSELDLTSNSIDDACGEVLSLGLSGTPLLRILRLGANRVGAKTAAGIAHALRRLPVLETLELGGNQLGNKGVANLTFELGAYATALRVLDLR